MLHKMYKQTPHLSGEAGCMSWLILRTKGTFLWRLMMASAYEVDVSEDDQRLAASLVLAI